MDIEKQTAETWTTYGAHQLTTRPDLPEIERWDWGVTDTGPDIESLGNVEGLRVLDLGSGTGRHAARLAALGADVTGVDASPTQHERAVTRYPNTPGLRFVCADAVAHLQDAAPYDLIYSINGLPFLDPHRLLPARPAAAPKPGRPGPGRPPGSRNQYKARIQNVGKTVKRAETIKEHEQQRG